MDGTAWALALTVAVPFIRRAIWPSGAGLMRERQPPS